MVKLKFLSVCLLSVFSLCIYSQNLNLYWSISESEKIQWSNGIDSTGPEGPVLSFKFVMPIDAPSPKIIEKFTDFIKLEECPKGLEPSKEIFVWGQKGYYKDIPYRELLVFPLIKQQENVYLLLSSFSIEVDGVKSFDGAKVDLRNCDALNYQGSFVNYWETCSYTKSSSERQKNFENSSLPFATTPVYRISINQDGIVKLTKSYLDSIGVNFSSVDPRKIHIYSRGVEIPIYVEGEEDGVFDSGDSIIFYGQKLFIRDRNVWNGGDFTDTNVYLLFADDNNGLRMNELDVSPTNPSFPETTTFVSNVTFETNNFMSWADHLRPNGELWFWGPGLFYVVGGGEKNRTISLNLPHPVSNSDSFSLQIVEAGFNDVSHILDAKINSSSYQRVTFSGKTIANLNYSFSQSFLDSNGSNTLTIRIPSSQTVNDNQIVDTVSVSYLRTTDADSDSLFIEDNGGNKKYKANGFSTQPIILDLSNKDSQTGLYFPQICKNAAFSSGQVTFDYLDLGGARKCFLSSSFLLPPVEEIQSRNLKDSNLGCKFLILTHPDFHPFGSDQVWQDYLTRKNSQFNNDVLWIDIQEVYDNFSYGIFDPTAIKTFLSYAKTNWREFPSYLLLIGDASYDYKNYYNDSTFKNWVPTMMIEDLNDYSHQGWMASDSYFGDVDGDGYPDLSTGRIPVRTYSEFSGVLTKIMAYEDQTINPSWQKTQFFVADTYDETWEEEFENYNTYLKNRFAVSPYQSLKVYYHDPPYNGTDQNLCAQDIRGYWDDAVLIHYMGHSGSRYWGYNDGILSLTAARGSDLNNLPTISSPYALLPFVVNSTCYITGFAYQGNNSPCLFEAFFNASDRGVIGSTGYTTISYTDEDETFTTPFFNSLFGISKIRTVGDAVEIGRFNLPSTNSRPILSLVLIGDPTTKILLPDVPPPSQLTATPNNQSALLSWQHPSSPPYGYNIYRSADGGSSYSKVNSSAVLYPNSSYTDSGLTNGSNYYYYVVSVNSDGFESAASNIVQVTPTNLNPPAAPTGLTVSDLGLGDSLKISWNPNSESDLSYYTLYWGSTSHSYTQSQNFSKSVTSTTISGLTTDVTYYFALTATNTSQKESSYSSEASGKPTNFPVAVRIPAMITDLRVERGVDQSGNFTNDLILKWTKPTVDTKGDPISVVSFDIYRVVNQLNYNLDTVSLTYPNAKISVTAVDGENTYTDSGAVTLANTVTYLVVAKDSNGNRSSASNQPPSPVMSLKLQKSETTNNTLIFFDPVTTTIDGKQTNLITSYKLYAFYPITSSKDHINPSNTVSPMNPALLSVPLPSCEGAVYCDSSTTPPLFYTVVAVDNRGNTSLY